MGDDEQLEVELDGTALPRMLEVPGYSPIIMTSPTPLKRPQELIDNENTSRICLCDAAKTILKCPIAYERVERKSWETR